jgi:hypothetical protein
MASLTLLLSRSLRFGLPLLFVTLIAGAATNGDGVPPDKLTIGDASFKVEVEKFDHSYAGMTFFDKKLIRIDPSSVSTMRRKVYLHELMHVAWHKGNPSQDKTRKYTEDEAIEELVPGLLQILEQNPEAVEYLRNSKNSSGKTVAQK